MLGSHAFELVLTYILRETSCFEFSLCIALVIPGGYPVVFQPLNRPVDSELRGGSQFLREMGGGAAPEGSIAGRRKALDAKLAPLGDEPDDEDEEPADYDALAAKISESGGTIVLPEDLSARAMKKSRREEDRRREASEAAAAAEAAARAKAKADEEASLLQYDESGRPKVKFVASDPARAAERRATKGAGGSDGAPSERKAPPSGAAVRNKTLLSFGGDEEGEA